jgi:hypothetical protein
LPVISAASVVFAAGCASQSRERVKMFSRTGMWAMSVAMIFPKRTGKRGLSCGITHMAKYNHLGPATAKHILFVAGAVEPDFQLLSSEQVTRLLIYADQYAYRPSRSVADSRCRAWHAYLLRRASQAETRGAAM